MSPKKHTLISFLAECEQEILSCQPNIELQWKIGKDRASAFIGYIEAGMYGLGLVDQLKELGWRRSSTSGAGPWWTIYVFRTYDYGTEDELYVRLEGMATEGLDGRPYDARPFFAPPRPPLPTFGAPSKQWEAENADWERKTANDEW